MTYRPFVDELAYSRGLAEGITVVQKFGKNPNVGTGAFEHVWFNGGAYNWLTAASVVRIQAGGNAADTAAGAGAREITIEGLDQNWNEATETLATAGAAASADTTTTFIRINRAFVSESGTYGGANVGNIIIETNPGALIVANLEAEIGQTQLGHYSVPDGKMAYLARARVYYSTAKDGSVRLMRRERADDTAVPVGSPRILQAWDEFSGESQRDFLAMTAIPGRSDIYFEAQANTSAGAINVSFDILLV